MRILGRLYIVLAAFWLGFAALIGYTSTASDTMSVVGMMVGVAVFVGAIVWALRGFEPAQW